MALIAGSQACVSSKCSGIGPVLALLPGIQASSRPTITAPASRGEQRHTLDHGREPPRHQLQQDRRTRGDDDEQRQPGDVRVISR